MRTPSSLASERYVRVLRSLLLAKSALPDTKASSAAYHAAWQRTRPEVVVSETSVGNSFSLMYVSISHLEITVIPNSSIISMRKCVLYQL